MFEILMTPTTPPNGRRLLHAMQMSAPVGSRIIGGHPDPRKVLMLYGMGGADRYHMALKHVALGGLLVAWDIGYWQRKGPKEHRMLRVSINGLHPPGFVLCGPERGAERWTLAGMPCRPSGGDKSGPVVLVGNGPKSNAVGAAGWAAAKAAEIRRAMPGVRLVYRPKPGRPPDHGVDCDQMDAVTPIDALLLRSSLVVCRHSNVAVDACRLGVPVVCDDGAAAAIYPARLEDREDQPSFAQRRDFLHRLAWWQWTTTEAAAGKVWPWLLGMLDEVRQPVSA